MLIVTDRLLLIKGTVKLLLEKVVTPSLHVTAGNIRDYSRTLRAKSGKQCITCSGTKEC
jgi:hypothetical protein